LAEIQDLHLAGRRQHDIFRFDVAMYDAVSVCGRERLRALCGNLEELLQAHGPTKAFSQSFALDVLHYEKELTVFFQNVVNCGYMF
jgi:hypothetical protein